MGSPAAASPPRNDALDRLRGAALVAMLVHHLTGWLTGIDARDVLPGWPEFALTDVAAPAFFVAAGMSLALFVASRRRRGLTTARLAGQIARRYGLLVPLGVGLRWVLGRSPSGFGVLEALGVTVVAAAVLAWVVPDRLRWPLTVATLVAGMYSTRLVTPADGTLLAEAVGGKFPVVIYTGFVLVGIVAVTSGAYADRRRVATATLLAVGASLALLADGIVPARYPGELPFVVPGLAGTVLVYAVGQWRWPSWAAPVDRLLRPAAAHTLGIFLAHYVLFEVLRNEGVNGSLEPAVAVPAAIAITLAFCLVAPRVPQLPWSPRTGLARLPDRPRQAYPDTRQDEPDKASGGGTWTARPASSPGAPSAPSPAPTSSG
jgi:peptidoglycan/LPS O-acetylase OafA/YrhL